MPRRPLKPCNQPGCPDLTRATYCERHEPEKPKRHRRDHALKTTERGYGHAHRKWRDAVLRKDPICRDCEQEGRVRPATEAHHINGNQWDRRIENGRGLCRTCHNRRTHGAQARLNAQRGGGVESLEATAE